MKPLLGALAATLIGLAMLVGGIVGVAGGFDGDDSGGSGSSEATEDVANFDSCPETDPRFGEFTTFEMRGEAGFEPLIVSCQGGAVEVSFISSALPADERRTLALWLYNSRKDARLIAWGVQEPGDNTVVLSDKLPLGSEDYKKLVLSEGPPIELEDSPRLGKVILQARI